MGFESCDFTFNCQKIITTQYSWHKSELHELKLLPHDIADDKNTSSCLLVKLRNKGL